MAVIEVPPSEPVRVRTNQHSPWLRQRLQARCEVRSLANRCSLPGGAFEDPTAHDRHAGGNA
ncbi:MAG: hypothetical protein WCB74_04390, partial [Pseudolabrys sp.]